MENDIRACLISYIRFKSIFNSAAYLYGTAFPVCRVSRVSCVITAATGTTGSGANTNINNSNSDRQTARPQGPRSGGQARRRLRGLLILEWKRGMISAR